MVSSYVCELWNQYDRFYTIWNYIEKEGIGMARSSTNLDELNAVSFGRANGMHTQNTCYTYFRMVGDFNPDYVSEFLNLKPEKSWKIGDIRSHGTKYDFACWEIGRCDVYEIEVAKQMRKTISLLLDKSDLLNRIREENDVKFY